MNVLKNVQYILLAAFFGGMTVAVQAGALVNMLDSALKTEPNYLGVAAHLISVEEKSKQARAMLFPQLTASVGINTNHRTYITKDNSVPPVADQFNSHVYQVNLTQPLWNHANFISHSQSQKSVKQAQYQLSEAEQTLAFKITSSWCEVLLARDYVTLVAVQMKITENEWKSAIHGVRAGMQSAVSEIEAEAKYYQSQSDHKKAQNELKLKRMVLEQLVGSLEAFIPPFIATSNRLGAISLLQPKPIEYWIQQAENKGPTLQASYAALEVASEGVRKQRAGHEPTLDMVGNYGSNSQNVGNFPGQRAYKIDQSALGVQLSVPLFSGGAQTAKMREAIALKEKAQQELEVVRRSLLVSIQQAWYGWESAHEAYQSHTNTLKALKMTLQATREGLNKGIKTQRECLLVEQAIEKNRVELNKSFYDMVTSTLKLKSVVGELERDDLRKVEQFFTKEDLGLDIEV